MKLKIFILAVLSIHTINIVDAGKTSFNNKLEKQNQRNLQKYNQKNKRIKKSDNEVSTVLFLSALYSCMQINKTSNPTIDDQVDEEFINEFDSALKNQLEKEDEMQGETNIN